MTVIDQELSLEEQCRAIWNATQEHARKEQRLREIPPLVRLWDGEMRLQHVVQAEYSTQAELIDGDTGVFEIKHPFDHPVGQWLWDEHGRLERGEKRNVNITIDYCESRLSGLLEYVELEGDEDGDQVITARFLSDYERLKWYHVWANPWLPEWIQFPRIFISAGPATWLLSLILDLQLQRERGSTWALPSDPMDPASRGSLNQSTWSMVVKPISFTQAMQSGVLWSIAASRFKNFHELAQPIMQDSEVSCVIRCYLEGDPPPWPGANLRHGTRVVSFEDKSGRFTTGAATGGTIWDGLIRTISEFVGDFIDSTSKLATDTTIPVEYFEPGNRRPARGMPLAIWRDGEITGLDSYRMRKTGSKGIQVITGGHSMPGVNELISATVQMIGDLTAMIPGVPPLGGAADAILRPFYEDTILAWMVARSAARANNQGWTRYFEYLSSDGSKAYTISSLMVLRAGFWATRSYEAHEFSARDGAPYLIGETGHVWLSDRAGYTVRGDKTGRIYIDRVHKVQLSWDRETPPTWTMTIGDGSELEDPVAQAWRKFEALVSAFQQLGF